MKETSKTGARVASSAFTLIVLFSITGCSANPIDWPNLAGLNSMQCTDFGSGVQPRVQGSYDTSDGRILSDTKEQGENFDPNSRTRFFEEVVEDRVDEYGPYSVTNIEYPSVDGVEIRGGLQEDDVKAIIELLTDFVSLHALDGIHIDNPSRIPEWFEVHGESFFNPETLEQVKAETNAGVSMSGFGDPLIASFYSSNWTTGEKLYLPLVRDGGPRIFNKTVSIPFLDRNPDDGVVRGSISAKARAVIDNSTQTISDDFDTGRRIFFEQFPETEDKNRLFAADLQILIEFTLLKNTENQWRFVAVPFTQAQKAAFSSTQPLSSEMVDFRNELRVCR